VMNEKERIEEVEMSSSRREVEASSGKEVGHTSSRSSEGGGSSGRVCDNVVTYGGGGERSGDMQERAGGGEGGEKGGEQLVRGERGEEERGGGGGGEESVSKEDQSEPKRDDTYIYADDVHDDGKYEKERNKTGLAWAVAKDTVTSWSDGRVLRWINLILLRSGREPLARLKRSHCKNIAKINKLILRRDGMDNSIADVIASGVRRVVNGEERLPTPDEITNLKVA